MGDIGMKVNLQPIADQSQLINDAIGGDFQAVTLAEPPGCDPDTQYVWWHNGKDAAGNFTNPVNFGRFNDPEINKLLDEGRTTLDDGEAQDDLRGPQQAVRQAALEHLGVVHDLVDRQSAERARRARPGPPRRQRTVPGSAHRRTRFGHLDQQVGKRAKESRSVFAGSES